mmetsp:Transcript_7485/g.18418  ORF Transcript_7485/g.18418 Transcript_7485/m.18418 type:complete len:219 (-) Transcript_7485:245-901(-)
MVGMAKDTPRSFFMATKTFFLSSSLSSQKQKHALARSLARFSPGWLASRCQGCDLASANTFLFLGEKLARMHHRAGVAPIFFASRHARGGEGRGLTRPSSLAFAARSRCASVPTRLLCAEPSALHASKGRLAQLWARKKRTRLFSCLLRVSLFVFLALPVVLAPRRAKDATPVRIIQFENSTFSNFKCELFSADDAERAWPSLLCDVRESHVRSLRSV